MHCHIFFLLPKRAERRRVPYKNRGREIMYAAMFGEDAIIEPAEYDVTLDSYDEANTGSFSGEEELRRYPVGGV